MTKRIVLPALVIVGFASTALADSHPTVTLGGHLDTYWGYVSEDKRFRTYYPDDGGSRRRDNALVNETKLTIRADGKIGCMRNVKYGGLIYLNADTSDDHYADSYEAQQTMAYLETSMGRLEAGSYTGASHALHVSATQIARGHSGIDGGGIDSDWWMWVNPAATLDVDDGITTVHTLVPQLYTNNIGIVGIKGVNASKITYFTPTWRGFQAGVSYIPDTESFGTVEEAMNQVFMQDANFGGIHRNIIEGGVRYAGKVGDVGFKAGLVGEVGDAKRFEGEEYHDLRAWEAGGALQYKGWTVAGAYGANGKAGQIVGESNHNNRYWDVGAAYEQGPFGISVTYAASKSSFDLTDDGEFDISHVHTFAVGADWQVAKGIKIYTDVVHFVNKVIPTDQDTEIGNKGTVVRVGSLLNF